MQKLIFSAALLLSLGLAGCGDDSETAKEKNEAKETEQSQVGSKDVEDWGDKIKKIAGNNEVTPDKYLELERYAMNYNPTTEEVDQFKKDIIAEYKSNHYLDDITDDEYMLTNIFKSYLVINNSKAGSPIVEFATDFFQNMSSTYRGEKPVDSELVKTNEEEMNKIIPEIE